MPWLLFLSRLSFICGVVFLMAVSLLLKAWLPEGNLESTIIIIGYAMGLVIFPIVNISYLAVWLIKRKLRAYVPLWLIIANALFLLALIYFIFYLNDPYYHQE